MGKNKLYGSVMLQTFLTSGPEWSKSEDFTKEFIKTYYVNSEIGYFWKLDWSILKKWDNQRYYWQNDRICKEISEHKACYKERTNKLFGVRAKLPFKKEVFGKIAHY